MNHCTLCGQECPDIQHLSLYCNGSEGIEACLACRMILTSVARGIQRTAETALACAARKRKHVICNKVSGSCQDPRNKCGHNTPHESRDECCEGFPMCWNNQLDTHCVAVRS